LLKHCLYNCAIDLQEEAQPPFGLIDNLSQNKLLALKEYIEENLTKKFFWYFKSSARAPILFVKKNDRSLQMYVDYHESNKVTIKNHYLLPLISGHLDQLV